jgi:hypothetical protein
MKYSDTYEEENQRHTGGMMISTVKAWGKLRLSPDRSGGMVFIFLKRSLPLTLGIHHSEPNFDPSGAPTARMVQYGTPVDQFEPQNCYTVRQLGLPARPLTDSLDKLDIVITGLATDGKIER